MSANGRVMLVNPAGILIGKTGQIDVGALTATTLNLANSNVLDGNGSLALSGSGGGAIRNLGHISVPDGGHIALVAPVIENRGSISAPGGAVIMAAGSAVDLDLGGQGLVSLRVNRGALDAAVTNGGIVSASGGKVVMTAKGLDDLSRAAVNNEGIIEAKGLTRAGGRILLGGGAGTDVRNSGLLDVSASAGEGGVITLEGETIALTQGARLDATGMSGGGTIQVGGSWQNSDPSVYQARTVSIAAGSVLDASATGAGTGGTIVAWSNTGDASGLTDVRGTLLARGGTSGGDGGRIETSGHLLKVDGIAVSTAAAQGRTGEWLLDPYNITIGSGGTAVSGDYTASGPSSLIDAATLVTALSTSNITVSTGLAGSAGSEAGKITVSSAIASNSAYKLELKAASSIVINADITRGGSGGLTLRAGTGSVSGTGNLVLGGGTKLNLAHGTTLANNIQLTSGGATIGFAPLEIEYLVVGGGAGARSGSGYQAGGGGGAVLTGTTQLNNTSSYAITVGDGGAFGASGSASSAFGVTANPGLVGVSVGVGGTSGSGFAGGANTYDGAGGGGAAGAGGNGTGGTGTRKAGYGGIGVNSSITGAVVGYGGGGAGGYTGATSISAGRIVTGSSSALGSGSDLTLANLVGTKLTLTSDLAIGSLAGGGVNGGNIEIAGNNLSVGSGNSSASYAGAITGTGGLTKLGSGTQTLTGDLSGVHARRCDFGAGHSDHPACQHQLFRSA